MHKKDFPIFEKHSDLIYLDSAATSLKPKSVINAVTDYLSHASTNISRGLYPLAEATTERFEAVRKQTALFLNADPTEIIFTGGTTQAINTVARLLESKVDTDSEILVTTMEHHSNFLPWKELALRKGCTFSLLPLTTSGEISLDALRSAIHPHTKILALSFVSNVLGTINPISEITSIAKEINKDIIVIVDAAQAAGHIPLDMKALNVDFLAFSAHKMFGSTGLGVLYGKKEILETLSPVDFGGGMVQDACAVKPEYKALPTCFEAGTPDIASVFALGAAITYITALGIENIRTHEKELVSYAIENLKKIFGNHITILGPTDLEKRGGVLSFTLNGIHPHDIAHIVGEQGICVRAGEHCTAPLHKSLGLSATTRISFSVYNETKDIDRLIEALKEAQKILLK